MCGSPVKWGQLCDSCKGFEADVIPSVARTVQPSPQVSPESESGSELKLEASEYVCPTCNKKHAGTVMGGRLVTSKCSECIKAKREDTRRMRLATQKRLAAVGEESELPKFDVMAALRRRLNDKMVLLDFSECEWILCWLREQTESTPSELLLRELASKVPAEWLKTHLLKRMTG
jgi:hypothetical protein